MNLPKNFPHKKKYAHKNLPKETFWIRVGKYLSYFLCDMVSSLSVFQLLLPEYDTLFPSPLKRRSETEFIILSVVWSGGIGCYLLCRSKAFVKIDEVAFIIVAVSILYAYFSFHNCFSPFPFSTCWFDFFFFFLNLGMGIYKLSLGMLLPAKFFLSCTLVFLLYI